MSGELHDISLAIGELRADGREASGQRVAMWAKLEEVSLQLAELRPIVEAVLEMKPQVRILMEAKQQGTGMVRLVMSAGAFLGAGAALKAILDRLFK